MNWKQLYASATPEEKLELLMHMMQTVETRQQRVVFTGRHWLRNRRQGYQAHFLNDRRSGRHNIQRAASLITFGVVLFTVSVATWGIVLSTPVHVGAPVLFFHVTALMGVYAFKPYRLRSTAISLHS